MKSQFDLKQNGYIKIKNQRTGIDVTFHIKSEKGSRNLYRKRAKRWVKLGQIIKGKVVLTTHHAKKEASQLYRDVLNNPTDSSYSQFAYQQEARCNVCNRPLKNVFSVWRGYGPECAKYMKG